MINYLLNVKLQYRSVDVSDAAIKNKRSALYTLPGRNDMGKSLSGAKECERNASCLDIRIPKCKFCSPDPSLVLTMNHDRCYVLPTFAFY